ncbi:hypothetical protein [Deinococcus misasensis]|nr:hypothetical protein [Deinococcus misasensis]
MLIAALIAVATFTLGFQLLAWYANNDQHRRRLKLRQPREITLQEDQKGN